jgi:(R)-2-hydroxyglutarate---pyruvate transhydrogenase
MLRSTRYLARRTTAATRRWAHTASLSHLKVVTTEDVKHFSGILPASSILSTLPPTSAPVDELSAYNTDWMGKYHGKTTTVLKPRSVQEVSEIVKYCNANGIGIVPQGGNTGLVGGSVPINNEVVLSLSNMSKIRSFDPVSGMFYTLFCDFVIPESSFRYLSR